MARKKVTEPAAEVKAEETEETEPETEDLAEPLAGDLSVTQTPKQQPTEMKIIIVTKADHIMLGVQSPLCDPVYKTMQGTLADALESVPTLVAEANLKWSTNPRYPKADLPTPPPTTASTRTPAAAAPAKPKAQPSFF